MTATKIRCRIDNPYGFPLTAEVDREAVGNYTGWNPEGEGVSKIWAALLEGKAVEVATNQLPNHRGIGKPAAERNPKFITFYPLAEGEDGLGIPASGRTTVAFRKPE